MKIIYLNKKINVLLFFRFLADFRDLTSWITDIKNVICADDLAKNVSGIDWLLEWLFKPLNIKKYRFGVYFQENKVSWIIRFIYSFFNYCILINSLIRSWLKFHNLRNIIIDWLIYCSGAEALLERHAEHKSEIDAREDSFRSTAEAGM